MATLPTPEQPAGGGSVGGATPPLLRSFAWPPLTPVDLASEFPWLILHERPASEWTKHGREDEEDEEHEEEKREHAQEEGSARRSPLRQPADESSSPYRQVLRAPREPPRAWSPAQRAARTMLQLQRDLERRDETARALAEKAVRVAARRSPEKRTPPVKTLAIQTKAKAAARETALTPRAKLCAWLDRQPPPRYSPATTTEETTATAAYSLEMEARIHRRVTTTLGGGLWEDEAASLMAAELTSESVFGGFVATRRLRFSPAQEPAKAAPSASPSDFASDPARSPTGVHTPHAPPSSSPTVTPLRVSAVEMFADEVREDARALAAAGGVGDALVALQAGIDRVLHDFQDDQDAIFTRGFNYSRLAHAMATRVQLAYKARHRRRVASLVRLQRAWRRCRAQSRFRRQRAFLAAHAAAIQRVYRPRFVRRKRARCAAQIQRCFRVWQEQKLLVWLHQACRLLNAQERRKREQRLKRWRRRRRVWARLRVLLRLQWLLRIRRFSVSCMQKRWRGWKARQAYGVVLSEATDGEAARRLREDAFVEPRLLRMAESLAAFYRETARGQRLVAWEAQWPWLRWRRLRHDWPSTSAADRAAALRGILGQRQDGPPLPRGLERLCVATVLRGEPLRPRQWLPSELEPTADDARPATSGSTGGGRLAGWRTQWRARVVHTLCRLLWAVVVYPRLVVRSSFLLRERRRREREAAAARLLERHRRVLRSCLRRVFRAVENDPPPYECAWCNEGFATTRAFFAHRNALPGGCAELERDAEHARADVRADVQHHTRSRRSAFRWMKRFQSTAQQHKKQSPSMSAPAAFAADAPLTRRVASRRANKPALQRLLAVAQCCSAGGGGDAAVVPAELLGLLLFSLDDAGDVHPLERLVATTLSRPQWTETQAPPRGWVRADEAARALGLSVAPNDTKPRLVQRAQRWVRATAAQWGRWRPMARVLAAA